ncbi:MAG: hypothetical protein N3F65_04110 [Nitrososphaeria archaeon]|nr:hypothetical protein [Aigarchaeota archaeon]MCX8187775.1 hypothetical protein [Nitrososphaeria archaeon]MDW8021765.1 hypothetical protein [Nitrososphaerota archaeon]
MRKSVRDFLRKLDFKIPDEKVLRALLELSSLTEPQLEVLLIEAASTSSGMKLTFREKAGIRGVAKGAYVRTLRQSIENIKKSIFTIFLLKYLGVIGEGAISSILEAADLLNQGRFADALNLINDVTLSDVTR